MSGLDRFMSKRRNAWQIALTPSAADPLVFEAKIHALPKIDSEFCAIRMLLAPPSLVLVGLTKNGAMVKTDMHQPVDEAMYQRFKTPPFMLGEHAEKLSEFRLRDNAIRLILRNGDHVEVRCRRESENDLGVLLLGREGEVPDVLTHVALLGFVEEDRKPVGGVI